ncbi:hypothetical protein [Rhodobacter sp. 24-YEA-8]|uniref:hypothetical protein n=1 Tax=Rhodobacter sp. 24-YEA-8 TaxID=1884310 RepID=UPI000896BDBB|nr:hypothetical protein [Rhodobacter sp. 24-YEA-8]SEC11881.1 hypothetical protein SAMN05519105_1985 [Rhodobacter sp. 24-YEA-8]
MPENRWRHVLPVVALHAALSGVAPVPPARPFNIAAVVQRGRLGYEALLLAASLRATDPGFQGRLLLAEPQPGPLWPEDPRLPKGALRDRLEELGAEFVPFDSKVFGAAYAIGNKIEMLTALPDEPFLFLDTDTLVTGPLSTLAPDFSRPSASMKREDTWPVIELYGPGYAETWAALYDRFGLDFAGSLDLYWPDEHWQRYMYFNAGWFLHESPQDFGRRFLDYAETIHKDRPAALVCQELWPWLDQIALPLVIASFGGGRPEADLAGLDGDLTLHYRTLPLLYATGSDRAVEVLETVAKEKENRRLLRDWEQAKQMVYQNRGRKARALFDQSDLPRREKVIRNTLRREGLWLR